MATKKILLGNLKGPQGETGRQGDPGNEGQRGTQWFCGTRITGTATSEVIFENSGVADTLPNDMYVNTYNGNMYRCVKGGNAATATWVYVGNIQNGNDKTVAMITNALEPAWAPVNELKTDSRLRASAYGNGIYVAVGDNGSVYFSEDSAMWVSGNGIDSDHSMRTIAYGNDMFVAGGEDNMFYYSHDGINWQHRPFPEAENRLYNIVTIAYGEGIFMAVDAGGYLYTSSDGITWSTIKQFDNIIPTSMVYGRKRFVLIGSIESGSMCKYTTFLTDGSVEAFGAFGSSSDDFTKAYATYANGKYVLVIDNGATYLSEDGIRWAAGESIDGATITAVTYGYGYFIAVALGGGTYSSTDGITWTLLNRHAIDATGLSYGNGVFVATGNYGVISCLHFVNRLENITSILAILRENDVNMTNDILSLKETDVAINKCLAEHNSEITANRTDINNLKAVDANHNTEINNLKAVDANHNTEINNLKAVDANHSTEINNLKAVDANHNTEINNLKAAINNIWSTIYPVGAIYMSVKPTDPGSIFGGSWVEWGAGRVPVGVDNYSFNFGHAELTGGEISHMLTVAEIPAHTHTAGRELTVTTSKDGIVATGGVFVGDSAINSALTTSSTGGNVAHNNLQPYITCYMWKRTA